MWHSRPIRDIHKLRASNSLRSKVYDGLSRMTQELEAANSAIAINQYDNVNQLTSTTRPLHSPATQSYDPLHRLSQQIDPAGGVTVYTYDYKDRLTTVTPTSTAPATNTMAWATPSKPSAQIPEPVPPPSMPPATC